jgi:hypothetical protein
LFGADYRGHDAAIGTATMRSTAPSAAWKCFFVFMFFGGSSFRASSAFCDGRALGQM